MKSLPPPTCVARGLSQSLRRRFIRFMLLGWSPHDIAAECRVHIATAYRYIRNLRLYGSPRGLAVCKLGRPRKLTRADEEALLELLLMEGWRFLDEMVYWLWCERGVLVNKSTISRALRRKNWTRKELRRISLARSEELRREWRDEMRQYAAEDLVFLDESIFNEKTGWRYRAYGPIGTALRYPDDIERGCTWSICAATTIEGWLPCTGVKLGYFNTPMLLHWLRTALFPALSRQGHRPRVIVLDNASTHSDPAIAEAIQAAGHIPRYLPPYSPDYNPIELSFSVLKAWLQRNYVWTRHIYEKENFGQYLTRAIRLSRCDRFAREHFRHAANGLYLEEGENERFRAWIRDWERGGLVEEEGLEQPATTQEMATAIMEVEEDTAVVE